ncbi:DUF3899 domain-containing protein [Halobacillus sp. ACCC02827]|uniref:DUF3899 domain-containing protein n=1 Tax=Bacillaceae TaxID=186817 RepID=UPI0002A4E63C|nr:MULTISPECIES: DUF3899 domain-containing protein [Bacillaceae]ELK45209.1 hypothetical protein D479_15807 [Halobacillus sp. BAB-2008]QHT46036.1 DUF3899 domain-containing protein [Bacillus sp. SB49]WJE16851.1 DUF3899 domain-containing protein [Halobacillus sp. ACCC02827]
MSIIRNKWLMILFNFALVTGLFFLLSPEHDLFHYINQLFYLAYFYLFIGILMWVIRGGFFDGIAYGFRRFYSTMSKQKDYLDDWKEKPLPSQTIGRSWLRFFLFQGSVLTVGLLALLVFYYQG